MGDTPIIGPYHQMPAACHEHDPRALEVSRKRAVLAEGITDSLDYSIRKGEFVANVLEALRVDAERTVMDPGRI